MNIGILQAIAYGQIARDCGEVRRIVAGLIGQGSTQSRRIRHPLGDHAFIKAAPEIDGKAQPADHDGQAQARNQGDTAC
ncbi:hypothetical protein HNP60_001156 [Sphingobium sp. B1D3A]|uniref:Uncharacterized protein n=1 Tax=Sphingobium lignivorans TaxID=2735886 RepID=A0ABR6ND13_9SPHN|nr:hypothetical protein [Sphingobium lignivorans]